MDEHPYAFGQIVSWGAALWQILERQACIEQFVRERQCSNGIVGGDVISNCVKIADCGRPEAYDRHGSWDVVAAARAANLPRTC